MGAYLGKVLFDIFGSFEFLTRNGTMDHAELSQHITNLTSQKVLVTIAKRQITVLDKIHAN